MRLTYKKGYFILDTGGTKLLKTWDAISPGVYSTASLKAAVAFKEHADRATKKIFDRILVKRYALPELPPLKFLDPHQREGLKWILTRSRSYLAHAPGAGKTAQVIIASLLTPGPGQVLFVVPPDLTINWEREILKFTEWLGSFPTITIVPDSSGRDSIAWRAEFIICPDSMLTKPWVLDALIKLDKKFVAVDEASRFKESDSQRTIALFGGKLKDGLRSPGLVQDARHAVLMDGSPLMNRAMELWAPTYAMAPEVIDFMDQQSYGFRYCGAKMNDRGQWTFRHSTNESELKEKLQAEFMHVVPESELSHPERLRSILFMNEDVRSVRQVTWERRHLSGIRMDDIDEEASQGDMATFRRELGIRKIPFIADYISDRLYRKDESILLFAWHREVCEGLADKLKKFDPCLVMGGTANDKRERFFSQFQAGKKRIIIGNIAAMGRGHNLQRADRVVFGEFSWTDELNKQCEKRASRRGRAENKKVRCEYIVCPGSMDEPIMMSNFSKAATFKKVIG